MSEKRLGSEETQTDIGCTSPILKRLGIREVVGAWTIVDQRNDNLEKKKKISRVVLGRCES